jgi:DNA-directed RNA polymerase specialized sigma24 family protein
MDLLQRVEGDFAALQRSGVLDEALRRWKRTRDALRSFANVEALIGFLRDPGAEPRAAKDSALAAISVEATGGDQTAATLVLWLMLPGLLRVRQRLVSWNALGREDLDAELLAGVWEAATAVGPSSTSVAARLVNRARRRAITAARRAADWAGRSEPLSTEMAGPGPEPGSNRMEDILTEAERAGVISTDEAKLFRATHGTIGEVRGRMGITVYGAQNRRRRARQRLLAWLADSLEPPRFLPLGSPQELPSDTPASPDKERAFRRHL